jgi:hypothetical protein
VADQAGAGLPAELIPAVALLDPRRAEDRDAVVDVTQRVETGVDLPADAVEAAFVVCLDVAGDAQKVLVVFRSGAVARVGQVAK